jgi:hypothetical protein
MRLQDELLLRDARGQVVVSVAHKRHHRPNTGKHRHSFLGKLFPDPYYDATHVCRYLSVLLHKCQARLALSDQSSTGFCGPSRLAPLL